MRNTLALLVSLLFFSPAFAEPVRVTLDPRGPTDLAAGVTDFAFVLTDQARGLALDPSALAEDGLRLVVFDAALSELAHPNASFHDGAWHANLNLARAGSYHLDAQGTIAADAVVFTAPVVVNVSGGLPANPTPPHLKDARSGSDGASLATLSSDTIRAEHPARLTLTFGRVDGSQAAIEGTPLVTVVLQKGAPLVETELSEADSSGARVLTATFPAPGFYRVWVEFTDAGQSRRVPLALLVNR